MAMFVVNATSTLAIEDSSANTKKFDKSYIKNIEISGTNVIKPEEILEKMQQNPYNANQSLGLNYTA